MQDLLQAFNRRLADIQASAIFSPDGVMIASTLYNEEDTDEVGAVAAAMQAIANQGATLLKRGKPLQVQVEYSEGNMVLSSLDWGFILVCLTRKHPNMGLLLHEMKRLNSELSIAN